MFFIKAGSILVWLLMVYGVSRIAISILIISVSQNNEQYLYYSKRYLVTSTTGEAIDKGLLVIALAIVLGLVVEIAKNTRDKD